MTSRPWLSVLALALLAGCPGDEMASSGAEAGSQDGGLNGPPCSPAPACMAGAGGTPAGAGGSSGGSASEPTAAPDERFVAATQALNREICDCGTVSFDECTDTTADQRACEADNAATHAVDAATWLSCMADFLTAQAECVRAAACDSTAVGGCEIIAQPDVFATKCGAIPTALDAGAEACGKLGEPPEFDCGDGESIPMDWVCDGAPDCVNESDEVGCAPSTDFDCGDGAMIAADWVCDGEPDCADGSDEAACASDV